MATEPGEHKEERKMVRIAGMVVAGVLAVTIAGGCREWRQQANEYKEQQRMAGTLMGKTPEDVQRELGRPSISYMQGDSQVYEYSYVESNISPAYQVGLDKPSTAREADGIDTTSHTMRVYFREGKMVGVSGN